MGMKSLLFVMKKYKSIISNFKDRGYISHLESIEKIDFYFKYFIELIMIPSFFSIYKILYFSERLNSHLKYLIYIIIVSFLQILNYFCEELTRELSFSSNSEYFTNIKSKLKSRLNINNFETDNLVQRFVTVGKSALDDFKLIDSPDYNKLDYHKLIIIFQKHTSLFNEVDKIVNNDIGQFIMNKGVLKTKFQEDSFRNALQIIYIDYSDSKNNFSNSVVAEIFNSGHYNDYSIMKNIAIEFLTNYQEKGREDSNWKYDKCVFQRDNAVILEILHKLFLNSPEFFQKIIMENPNMKEKIFFMLGHQVAYLYQIVVVEFMSLNKKDNLYAYENLLNLIEFGRLLAENHNQMFQTFLLNFRLYEIETESSLTFFQMMLKISIFIIKLIKHNKSKTIFLNRGSGLSYIYFNNLITYVHNFLIEIVQGTLSSNFEIISNDPVFKSYIKLTRDLFNEPEIDEYVFYLGKSLAFLNSVAEDTNNTSSEKPIIYFKGEKFYQVLLDNFKLFIYIGKNIYSKKLKTTTTNIDSSFDFYKLKFSSNTEEVNIFTVKEGDHEIVNDLFICEILYENNPYYILAYQIFYMFKLVEINPSLCSDGSFQMYYKKLSSKGVNTIEKNSSTNIINSNSLKHLSNDVLVIETYLFFNELIKSVEIITKKQNETSVSDLLKFKEYFKMGSHMENIYENASEEIQNLTSKNDLLKIIFVNKPNIRFLKQEDTYDFIEIYTKNEPSNRKFLILKNIEERLLSLVEIRRKLWMHQSKVINYFYNIHYSNHITISAFISLIINILLVFSMKYDNISSTNLSPYDANYAPFQTYISFLNSLHLIYIGPLICSFICFKIYEDLSINQSNNYLGVLGSIVSVINNKRFILVWNFVCGCLAFTSTPFCIFYALQLFSMMSIFPLMKAAISSVFLRYGQFLATALLLIIVCIFYTSICIFFLNSEITKVDNKSTCETFLQCALHIFNGGIRSGSLGFPVKDISASGYWQEFIVDWTFYLIVILILLNFVNGIIVDTFNELYEAELSYIELRDNTCIICDQNRSKYEVVGLDFDKHRFYDHNLLNYFYYIIRIKKENKHNLNALDSEILESIEARRTDFIPNNKSWDIMQTGDNDE